MKPTINVVVHDVLPCGGPDVSYAEHTVSVMECMSGDMGHS